MPIVRLTHNISSALHIGLNIVERVQTLLVVLHIVCVYYTTDVMDDISLLVSLGPNPNPAERLQEKGSNGKRFDFFFIRTFFRSILFPDPPETDTFSQFLNPEIIIVKMGQHNFWTGH